MMHDENRLLLLNTDCEFAAIHTALAKLVTTIPPEFASAGYQGALDYDEYLISAAIDLM